MPRTQTSLSLSLDEFYAQKKAGPLRFTTSRSRVTRVLRLPLCQNEATEEEKRAYFLIKFSFGH